PPARHSHLFRQRSLTPRSCGEGLSQSSHGGSMTLTSHVHKDATQLLIDTINATGGLLLRPDGTQAPLGDPDWLDLADAYLAACTEKGIDPVVTVDRESDDADKELSMSDDHQLIDKAALEPNNTVTAISTILETLCD